MGKGLWRWWAACLTAWGVAIGYATSTLAIGAFEGEDEALTQAVRQQVVQVLSRSAHLQIADRAQLRAVLQERRLRDLGLTGEPEHAPTPLAPAERLLVGRVSIVDSQIQIDLSCHDLQTGTALMGGSESVTGARAAWETLAQRAAERIHRRLTGKSLPMSFAIEPLPDEGVPPTIDAQDYVSSPYRASIERALQRSWMRLYPDGTFRPDEPVSGVYFHALLQRLAGRLGGASDYTPEKPDETLTCAQAVRYLSQLGASQPRTSYLHPPAWAQRALQVGELRTPLTRARLAALLDALIQSVQEVGK